MKPPLTAVTGEQLHDLVLIVDAPNISTRERYHALRCCEADFRKQWRCLQTTKQKINGSCVYDQLVPDYTLDSPCVHTAAAAACVCVADEDAW